MADPEVAGVLDKPAAGYQVFALKPQHNAILARRAAELIYKVWPHEARIEGSRLLVLKPFDITLKRAPDERADLAPLQHRVENAFVGIEAGIKSQLGTQSKKHSTHIEVTTSAALGEVLRRVGDMESVSLSQIKRENGIIKILITNPYIVMRPLTSNKESEL